MTTPIDRSTVIFMDELQAEVEATPRCGFCRGGLAVHIELDGEHTGEWDVVQCHELECPAASVIPDDLSGLDGGA